MADETTGAAGPGRGGRMSRQRKRDAVLRLLRGEDLEMVSRALGVTAATLTAWRDAFLAAGEASLSTRPADGRDAGGVRLEARNSGVPGVVPQLEIQAAPNPLALAPLPCAMLRVPDGKHVEAECVSELPAT